MDNDISTAGSIGATVLDLPLNRSEAVTTDYSPDDEDLDEAAAAAAAASEATRDTLADGLVASLLRPCVDRLDASVQCTRLSQLDLKLQLDSLATELKRLSLAQQDYLFATTSISSPQLPVSADKTTLSTAIATTKTTTDTCVLLDGYARRLCDARAKIAVVGNILESTQERLRALSHRIGREHNNRRSLLEPQAVVIGVEDELELEEENDKNNDVEEEINDNNEEDQPNKHLTNSNDDNKEEEQPGEDATVITISPAASEIPKKS
ncbi:uncharacterized protein LOC132927027 [Rhopalosiphum padi]|uniref:uncharacterized protein LOC132927027 n=1 Tax=Rhopalosiphum padi TaxID=40932 RepID=UPI00298E600F|nr:uncharacterized protein LOC132927027 [Rhopalosiphum padi]XP_060847464.1 uncharacterized protein LOC132927027 [Rhopalosiphum padi]